VKNGNALIVTPSTFNFYLYSHPSSPPLDELYLESQVKKFFMSLVHGHSNFGLYVPL
jgi:hypothetical protein